MSYLAFNHDRPEFKGAKGIALAKAINYAIDRKAMLAQGGYLAGKRTDQILPPGIAGFRDANLYPLKGPDIGTAKKWAAKAGLKSGTTLDYYTSNTGSAPLVAQILQFNLKQIGLSVNSHLFARAVQIDKEGTRGEPFDITSEAWIADYADPYDFINVLLSGDNLHASNNNNVAYFNDPTYNKEMRAASLLSGAVALHDVRQPRRVDDEEQSAVGGPLELQRPHPGLEEGRLLHVQPDLQRRSRGALPEVEAVRRGAQAVGCPGGAPHRPSSSRRAARRPAGGAARRCRPAARRRRRRPARRP